MGGNLDGLIRGGQGRTATDVLGYACCVRVFDALVFLRNLLSPRRPRPPQSPSMVLSRGGRVPFWERD